MKYTHEDVNELLGKRNHRKATVYDDLELAKLTAVNKSLSLRKFALVNVLDEKGKVVFSVRGIA